MYTLKQQWFGNVRGDILAGIVVGLALIPEALAFAFIVGVHPGVALYASFTIAVITSLVGGRPGLISAATGAMALVLVSLMASWPTICTCSHNFNWNYSINTRRVWCCELNALHSKLCHDWICECTRDYDFYYANALFTWVKQYDLLICDYYINFSVCDSAIFTAIPVPLIAIVVMTSIALISGVKFQTIGDLGTMPNSLPLFFLPDIPLNFETLKIIFPYSLALSIVGLLESLLTSQVLDDLTDTPSNKNIEARGQGIANFITGFFGGMAGCALIGQSIINIKSGGRGRLSTLTAGVFLLFLIIVLGDVVIKIPMPVLVGVMIMVSFTTFNWGSFKFLKQAPKSESLVMLITVAIILYTHNLAIGVVIGVILSALFFVAKISRVTVTHDKYGYKVKGPLFFASTTKFIQSFESVTENEIVINFENSQLWDESAVAAIFKVKQKLEQKGVQVQIQGLNSSSEQLYKRLT